MIILVKLIQIINDSTDRREKKIKRHLLEVHNHDHGHDLSQEEIDLNFEPPEQDLEEDDDIAVH